MHIILLNTNALFNKLILLIYNFEMTTKTEEKLSTVITPKPNTMTNIKNIMKIGSDKLKEKV